MKKETKRHISYSLISMMTFGCFMYLFLLVAIDIVGVDMSSFNWKNITICAIGGAATGIFGGLTSDYILRLLRHK